MHSFKLMMQAVQVTWLKNDGDRVAAGEAFLKLAGSARSLLTVERPALKLLYKPYRL